MQTFPPEIPLLHYKNFFRLNESVHIQLSSDYPDYFGILHQHDFIEVIYVISGTAFHQVDGAVSKVRHGDLFIINMNTPHAFWVDPDCSEPFVTYDLMFTPNFFDASIDGCSTLESLRDSFMFYSLFGENLDYIPYFSVSDTAYSSFGDLFNKIYLEHRSREKGYLQLIRAYLLQLMVMVFRLDKIGTDGKRISRDHQAVCFAVQYINDHYATPLSSQKLADMVYLSRDYLGRIFKEQTGMSITSTIQQVRIQHVCRLLVNTNESITEIAKSCGFEDIKFFYSIFKKHMHLLPGDYRKQRSLH